jgi:rhodanese-related sulfurtransferase
MTTSADLARDIAGVAALAVISLIVALTINHFSAQPLPMPYQSPQHRLQSQLAELVAAPPFESFPVATIDFDQFRDAVNSKSDLILDARSATFYRQGHVPGAINLSRDRFASDYIGMRSNLEKNKDREILVYCSGGACHDSKMVAQALTSLGFSQVRIFAGGWAVWTAAGLPADMGVKP